MSWFCFFSFVFFAPVTMSVYIETNGFTNWADTEKLSYHNLSFPGSLYFSLKTCQSATLTLHPVVAGERSLTFHFEEWDQAGNVYGTASVGRVTDTMAIYEYYSQRLNISSSCDRFQTYWMTTWAGYVYLGSDCYSGDLWLYRNSVTEFVTVEDVGLSSTAKAEWLFASSCDLLNASLPNKTDVTTQGITTNNGDTGTTAVSPGTRTDKNDLSGTASEITGVIWLLIIAQMIYVIQREP